MQGPLKGLRVVEFAGIGPGPFCAMLLSDMGADVVRIDRADAKPQTDAEFDLTLRGRRSVGLDLKSADGRETALALVERADALIEGFRPGVMERLGLGPEAAFARNERLIYGRVTGWGQTGALAQSAGHDINYIALTGALYAVGTKGAAPPPPLNLIGDYAGGALYLAMGVCAALFEARGSGKGQVIDCAIIDGVTSLLTVFHGMRAAGSWSDERESNLLDGDAPFYRCYECADGRWISVGAVEPQFFALLLSKLGLSEDARFREQNATSLWAAQKEVLRALFKSKPRLHWVALLEGTDACFAPVLDWEEALRHPHALERGIYAEAGGVLTGQAAPRFSRTPTIAGALKADPGQHTMEVLQEWGVAR